MTTFSSKKIEDAVLALLYASSTEEHGMRWAWKNYDWAITDSLFEKGLIDNPRSGKKSLILTPEGVAKARALADSLFRDDTP